MYSSRRCVSGLLKGQEAVMCAVQSVEEPGDFIILLHFGQCFFALPEGSSGWGSPPKEFLHCHNSFLCTVSLTARCHNSECEPWIISVLLGYITVFLLSDVQSPMALQMVAILCCRKILCFFQLCHQQSVVLNLLSWATRDGSASQLWSYHARSNLGHSHDYYGAQNRIHSSWEQSWKSCIHATPITVWGSFVCTAPQGSLLSGEKPAHPAHANSLRSFTHWKNWKLASLQKLVAYTDKCNCAACGWHRTKYKFVCSWIALSRYTQKAPCTGNRNPRIS